MPSVVEGLEELHVDRWIGNADEFSELVRAILERPDVQQRGCETAEAASARFANAIAIVGAGGFPAALVSHGRVLSAWLSSVLDVDDPFALWRSLPMPAWCAVDLDDLAAGFVTPVSGLP
jgi:broad specificity phosphatase PhoE